MKKIPALFNLLAALWLGAALPAYAETAPAAARQSAPATAPSKGLLWKIEQPGMRPSYLFGTIHSEDARVLNLPPVVQKTFDAAGSFTMEVLLDQAVSEQMTGAMFFSDGRDLKTLMGEDWFKRISAPLAGYGVPADMAQKMKPWAVFATLSLPKPQTGLFLDMVLYANAQQQGKPVYGLESVDEQLAVFNGMAMQDQIALLKNTVENHAQIQSQLEQIIQSYLARDLGRMERLSDEFGAEAGDPRLVDALNQRMVFDRNVLMAQRMLPRLKEGNAFIAVGSLHLPGEQGVLRLLQQRGYRVTPIY